VKAGCPNSFLKRNWGILIHSCNPTVKQRYPNSAGVTPLFLTISKTSPALSSVINRSILALIRLSSLASLLFELCFGLDVQTSLRSKKLNLLSLFLPLDQSNSDSQGMVNRADSLLGAALKQRDVLRTSRNVLSQSLPQPVYELGPWSALTRNGSSRLTSILCRISKYKNGHSYKTGCKKFSGQ